MKLDRNLYLINRQHLKLNCIQIDALVWIKQRANESEGANACLDSLCVYPHFERASVYRARAGECELCLELFRPGLVVVRHQPSSVALGRSSVQFARASFAEKALKSYYQCEKLWKLVWKVGKFPQTKWSRASPVQCSVVWPGQSTFDIPDGVCSLFD